MESINGVLGDAPSPAQMHDVEREDVLLICGASVVLEDSEESVHMERGRWKNAGVVAL